MRRCLIAMGSTLALTAAMLAAVDGPAYAEGLSPIADSHPAWAISANLVSAADDNQNVTFRVYLRLRDVAGARKAAEAVSTPGGAQYRKFLSGSQIMRRFAPTRAAVEEVSAWLRECGLRVGEVAPNNISVQATGPAAKVRRAFGVDLNLYRVRGRTVRAGDRALSVPASLGSIVSGVVGVDGSLELLRPATVAPPAGFRNPGPCGRYWAELVDTTDPPYGAPSPARLPYVPCGYTPAQLRSAYGLTQLVDSGRDGRGVRVAIVDAFASPTLYQDAAEYARRNDPRHPLRADQYSQIVFPANADMEPPDRCAAAGWYSEQTLDVEAVHAMAPGANILFVGGSDCDDLSIDKALNEVVARDLAQVVSNSYVDVGEDVPAAVQRAFDSIAIQAVLKGIGLYFASGDNGDATGNLGYASPNFPASNPWVTAVGGTSLGIDRHGRTALETGWQTARSPLAADGWGPATYLFGSGGGTSRRFAQPFYQRGVVPDALARQNRDGASAGRTVPDIAMDGDPNTGILVGQTQTFPDGVYYDQYRMGGTSLATPLFAGYAALADQVAGHRHGFINPTLYQVAARTGAVRDVRHVDAAAVRVDYANRVDPSGGLVTSVRTFDFQGLAIRTAPGYDTVTGLGTPRGAALLAAM